MIFILTAYTNYFSQGKAFTERLIGEFYFSESRRFDALAKTHFDISLLLYTKELAETKDPLTKGRIEALIGSQYECGKGVSIDLGMAKQWYQAASGHGNLEAQQALNNVEAHLLDTKGDAIIGKQCFAPFEMPKNMPIFEIPNPMPAQTKQ
jgi:TPR repeat protein